MRFVIRVLVNAAAIVVAAHVVPGIEVANLTTALVAGLVLGLINATIWPVVFVLTLPLTLLTLGLFIFVVNAFCLWLTATLVRGFAVHGVWNGVVGALLISLVSWLLTAFISERRRDD